MDTEGTASLRICRRFPEISIPASTVTPVMRQARRESGPDRIGPYQNYRYSAGRRAGRLRDTVAGSNDHVRVAADDLASEIGIALGPSPAGISVDCEVLSLDIAQSAQLLEKRPKDRDSRVVDASDGTCCNDRNPVRLRPLLRPHRSRGSGEQQPCREVAPSHSITSSARARSKGGIVRPSALAVLRLITSSNLVGCSTGRSDGFAPLRILAT